jgi:hypothetical protein
MDQCSVAIAGFAVTPDFGVATHRNGAETSAPATRGGLTGRNAMTFFLAWR